MKKVLIAVTSLGAIAAAGASYALAHRTESSKEVTEAQISRNWAALNAQVYVDRETHFAYVKTPAGWKFVRQIEPEKMALVPVDFMVPQTN